MANSNSFNSSLRNLWPLSNNRPRVWNPWKLMKDDIYWVLSHPYDVIVEFLYRNSIGAMRFEKVHNDEATCEINLSYWKNWISIIQLAVWTLATIPLVIFYPLLMLSAFEQEKIRPPKEQTKDDEKWFFINGVTVNEEWLDQNCKYLEERFGIGVTGILNRSYGIFWDFVEAVLERSFNFETIPVHWATCNILRELRNENVKVVRLVAHSQGTIIAYLTVRKLFTELSYTNEQNYLNKLEVYTFANVCRDFINPNGLVGHIEHYVNKRDPVAMLGVLNETAGNRIEGNVFINDTLNEGKGHLFNSFYSLNAEDYISPEGAECKLLNRSGNVDNLPINI
ncbi:unnamed protein product [Rhizophagus irregularis]|nr:unnamed protein product [Rhizophagus irregularis]CAB5332433.1 unnamed protein product [Rhizophagus irregularis]